ncbi:Dabb family protein [Flagellimonas allohymeniacidonis]|uniref:Dabb family protein n=1 Tax=Flagellimonas allohymeniacidonis TaxID=2517819 RepID=A0A4Q8QFR3_9FLAO|nr:Dabb family protein [Allomuricauda hymeniacidonis]TAI47169.1 Dabb family protein [Allomuricauda hymeniacidonis]
MKTKHIAILIFGLLTIKGISQTEKEVLDFDPAFSHSVYVWLKEPNNPNVREQFETSLKKFLRNSKFAKTNFIGVPPKATRDVVDDSYTYSLIVTFESAEAQDGYQKEEAHLIFIEECKELWEKVLVYDALGLEE